MHLVTQFQVSLINVQKINKDLQKGSKHNYYINMNSPPPQKKKHITSESDL